MSASRRPALLALTLTLAAATAVTGVSGCGSPWGGSDADTTPPTGAIAPRPTVPSRPPAPGVQVSGNRFVDLQGRTVRLTGFNHSGAEYACIEGPEIFDTPDGTAL